MWWRWTWGLVDQAVHDVGEGVGEGVAAADDVAVVGVACCGLGWDFAVGCGLEGCGVEKDGENGDAASVHLLEDAGAAGDGAGGDDDGEAALGEFALGFHQQVGERDVSFGFDSGKGFQDYPELGGVALGDDGLEGFAVDHEADVLVGFDEADGEGGGDGDGVFFGAFGDVADLAGGLEVEDEPDGGVSAAVEFLAHQAVGSGGGGPVDAVEAVAGAVFADAGGGGAGAGHEAGAAHVAEGGGADGEAGHEGNDLGVDGDGLGLSDEAADGGQAEGVGSGDFRRADGVESASDLMDQDGLLGG